MPKNDSSSLRMFLEELKNEDNIHNSNLKNQLRNQNYQNQQFSPSHTSLASSANIEIIKMQEESFSKIHNDIASLQNKIKGLEHKLGPTQSTKNQKQRIDNEAFQERQVQSNRRQQEENRIIRYSNRNAQTNQNQKQIIDYQKLDRKFIDEQVPYSFKENKENQRQVYYNTQQDDGYNQTSESDTASYQTFPLRLKKQYLQQQLDIEHKRAQLNERFNQPFQKQYNPPQYSDPQIIRERYEAINDSVERKKQQKQKDINNSQQIQFKNQIRSLTETDQDDSPEQIPLDVESSSNSSKMNDSTISVNEKMKRKIKEKIKKYKEKRTTSKQFENKSPSTSLKRSNTQDLSKNKDTGKKMKRQVRFSDNKRSSRSKERRLSHHSTTNEAIPQELLELRKENAFIKLELDKLRKKLEIREEYYNKWRDLKLEYKQLSDDYKKQETKKKEYKILCEEQKVQIKLLKKKTKLQKEKLKRLKKGESPEVQEKSRVNLKSVSKTYKQFKFEEGDNQKQKSQRKLQPSDVLKVKGLKSKLKKL